MKAKIRSKEFRTWHKGQKAQRFRKSPVAQIIRNLKRQGKSNAEIKVLAPALLKERRDEMNQEQTFEKYSPFRRAAALARMQDGKED